MKFEKTRTVMTDILLPKVWQDAVIAEKKAELLIYYIIIQCVKNISDVSILLSNDNPVCKVIKSWIKNNQETGFGTNAICLNTIDEKTSELICCYDLYKLTEDIEMLGKDMFGTINVDDVGESTVNEDIDIPNEDLDNLFMGIRKRL